MMCIVLGDKPCVKESGQSLSQSSIIGGFGNSSLWSLWIVPERYFRVIETRVVGSSQQIIYNFTGACRSLLLRSWCFFQQLHSVTDFAVRFLVNPESQFYEHRQILIIADLLVVLGHSLASVKTFYLSVYSFRLFNRRLSGCVLVR